MQYIKLTMTFLDKTTDKKIQSIYEEEFKGKGRELGEMSVSSEGKVKTVLIAPREEPTATAEDETLQEDMAKELTINDFTTKLVLTYKMQEIKTETWDDEEPTATEETSEV